MNIPDAPKKLFIKGKILERDERAVAIVGSRKMTSYGEEVTKNLVKFLVKNRVTIISGLARGIDTIAHQTALDFGGRTIAVLGHGLSFIYPPENKALAEKIVNHGALVSEYPDNYPIYPKNFYARNRIVSGLSKAVVVVEGTIKSGTMLTVKHALNQGKTVFAVPGPITSEMSAGPNFLISQGAIPLVDFNLILDELISHLFYATINTKV